MINGAGDVAWNVHVLKRTIRTGKFPFESVNAFGDGICVYLSV